MSRTARGPEANPQRFSRLYSPIAFNNTRARRSGSAAMDSKSLSSVLISQPMCRRVLRASAVFNECLLTISPVDSHTALSLTSSISRVVHSKRRSGARKSWLYLVWSCEKTGKVGYFFDGFPEHFGSDHRPRLFSYFPNIFN